MKFHTVHFLLLMGLAGAGVYEGIHLIFQKSTELEQKILNRGTVPTESRDVKVEVVDEEGNPIARLEAEKGTSQETLSISYLTGITNAEFYEKGEKVASLKARKASYDWNLRKLQFEDKIQVVTSDGARISTNSLYWAKQYRTLFAPSRTLITTRDGHRFSADVLLYYPDQKMAELFGNVKVQLKGNKRVQMEAEYIQYQENFQYADLYGKEWTKNFYSQRISWPSRFFLQSDLTLPFRREKASVRSGKNTLFADSLKVDTETKKVYSVGRGDASFGSSSLLSADSLEFYWELGYLFARGNVDISHQSMSITAEEATVIVKENQLRLSGNVLVKDSHPEWFYTGAEAPPGTLRARLLQSTIDEGDLIAEGDVLIEQGQSSASASKLAFFPSSSTFFLANSHVTTERYEVFARTLTLKQKEKTGEGSGDLRLTLLKEETSIRAPEGNWKGSSHFHFTGGTEGKYKDYTFSASSVTKEQDQIALTGKARLTGKTFQASAEALTLQEPFLSLKGSAELKTRPEPEQQEDFILTADAISLDTEKKSGTATGSPEIHLLKTSLPSAIGAGKGPLVVIGRTVSFTYEPVSMQVDGNSRIQQGRLTITGSNFLYHQPTNGEREGELSDVTLNTPENFLGSDGGATLTGSTLSFAEKKMEITGNARLQEEDTTLSADKFSSLSSGEPENEAHSFQAEGNVALTLQMNENSFHLTCSSLKGEKENDKIDFAGPVKLESRDGEVTGDSAYFLVLDSILVVEGNITLTTKQGAELKGARFLYDLKTGLPTLEKATGDVGM